MDFIKTVLKSLIKESKATHVLNLDGSLNIKKTDAPLGITIK